VRPAWTNAKILLPATDLGAYSNRKALQGHSCLSGLVPHLIDSHIDSPAEILRWLVVRTEEQGGRPSSSSYRQLDDGSPDSQYERPRWDFWLYGAGFVAVILVAASLLSPWVRHEWALSLGRQPTPYTQLGFSHAAGLPVTGVRGKGIPISFVITNDEGKQLSYRYVVASGSGTTLTALRSEAKVVAAGASWDVDIVVVPKCAASSCRVQVSLPEQDEKIDFMLTYPGKSGKKAK
jgi:hypothetical protein